ncbi:MAG: hypothetical protein ABI131_12235 [Nostocoides sp.]
MLSLIIGLLVCVVIAGLVVAMVAIPARREGRDLLTARGEDMLARGGDLVTGIKERSEAVVDLVTPGTSAEPVAPRHSRSSTP